MRSCEDDKVNWLSSEKRSKLSCIGSAAFNSDTSFWLTATSIGSLSSKARTVVLKKLKKLLVSLKITFSPEIIPKRLR